MSAPSARTCSGYIVFTVACVPTGMKAGVRISPRGVSMRPVRAAPSPAVTVKGKPLTASPRCPFGVKQAGVAVGIEAIAGVDRMRVGALHGVEPGERSDQHEERRARQMEVRHQKIDGAKAIARRDEDVGRAVEGMDRARLVRGRLKQPQRRRADGDDAPAALPRRIDALARSPRRWSRAPRASDARPCRRP